MAGQARQQTFSRVTAINSDTPEAATTRSMIGHELTISKKAEFDAPVNSRLDAIGPADRKPVDPVASERGANVSGTEKKGVVVTASQTRYFQP